ncbi:MAG: hypothetical protein QM572_17775 [Nocardioides sp.]|uniref:hypothetical protein n=1 Tax=Nocardioides sp. TaxID=35761 RepID=UPI0039E37024
MAETEGPYWDEDDHDLLTFHESGVRLRKEITHVESALDAAGSTPERALLEARLAALRDAQERSSRSESENPGEAGFLSYQPPASDGTAD